MSITVKCDCGKELFADFSMSGTRCKCPSCGAPIEFPFVEPEPEPEPESVEPPLPLLEPEPPPAEERPIAEAVTDTDEPTPVQPTLPSPPLTPLDIVLNVVRSSAVIYAIALFVFLPLAWHVLIAKKLEPLEQRLGYATQSHSSPYRAGSGSPYMNLDDILKSFPGHRLPEAFLPRDSMAHYLFGISAALLFFGMILFLSLHEEISPFSLLGAGFLTGTLGVIYLIIVQTIAIGSLAIGITTSIVGIVMKVIGFSYMAAFDPNNGFLLSLFGFTFGVGLCEEACKALPIIICFHDSPKWNIQWRTAMVWGMSAGVGFGVVEGLIYAGQYYNGIMPGEVYFVRFLTCVGLHAAWAGASSIAIFRHRKQIFYDTHEPLRMLSTLIPLLAMPTFLHGLYDTVLKKELDVLALLVALATFMWLIYQMVLADRTPVIRFDEEEDERVLWT